MVQGEVVTIYELPLTRERPEGEAKLVKLLYYGPNNMQRWWVRFEGDTVAVERWILKS